MTKPATDGHRFTQMKMQSDLCVSALPKKYLNIENNGRLHWERGRPRPQSVVKNILTSQEEGPAFALPVIAGEGARAPSVSRPHLAESFFGQSPFGVNTRSL